MAETTYPKMRGRVAAGSSAGTQADPWAMPTADSFVNFEAKLGIGANNQMSAGTYRFNFLTRNRYKLDAMYRGSWLVGQAVDVPAEDMTRGGIAIKSKAKTLDIELLMAAMSDLTLWQQLASAIKWGRLYGGCIAVPMVDGMNLARPLNLDAIARDSFKGLMILDRWQCVPSIEKVTEYGPDFGLPLTYKVYPGQGIPAMEIHHTRALRFTGTELPYWQRQAELYWGASVMERIYDRLVAYDSTSTGVAQLAFKAHLRSMKIKGLRSVIASGGPLLDAVVRNVEMIRRFQTNEGLTILDGDDELETTAYTFAGLDDVLSQFGQQLGGALEIPLVRLFGQAPKGLNATGEGDLRNYYDNVVKRQETALRRPLNVIMDLLSRSVTGKPAGETFTYKFHNLYQMTPVEKAQASLQNTQAIMEAKDVVRPDTLLKELRQSSEIYGTWSNISEEEIKEAEDAPPPHEAMNENDPETGSGAGAKPNPGESKSAKGN